LKGFHVVFFAIEKKINQLQKDIQTRLIRVQFFFALGIAADNPHLGYAERGLAANSPTLG
jgi:hypothetical protein